MHVFDWMEATRPNKPSYTQQDADKMRATRVRVLTAANTTWMTLINAKYRLTIGGDLVGRLVQATNNEDLKITKCDYKI